MNLPSIFHNSFKLCHCGGFRELINVFSLSFAIVIHVIASEGKFFVHGNYAYDSLLQVWRMIGCLKAIPSTSVVKRIS